MPPLRRLSAAEQVAAHLREELLRGRWSGVMPGVILLSKHLGVSRNSVEAALRQLEHEGLLLAQGVGRRRMVVSDQNAARSMRIALLTYEPADRTVDYLIELQHALSEAGHTAIAPDKTLSELGMNPARVSRLVKATAADAWVVHAASREVLEWFVAQPAPAFALFGRRHEVSIAAVGPDKPPTVAATTRCLVELGHQRIVMLAREVRRLPEPGATERAFLAELETQGISPTAYNLPDWKQSIEGFHQLLESLFQVTPPTALIVDEAPFFVAALQFLAERGLRVPADVSLVCTDAHPVFDWCQPSVAHIRWDSAPVVRRIVRWAANVSRGTKDLGQSLTKAEFVQGGTIGPAKE